MVKTLPYIAIFLIVSLLQVNGLSQNTDSTLSDSVGMELLNADSLLTNQLQTSKKYTLLDTLRNPTLLRAYFFTHEQIKGTKIISNQKTYNRSVPGVKQIKLRPNNGYNWKFWLMVLMVILIIAARLTNIKIFDKLLFAAYQTNNIAINTSVRESAIIVINLLLYLVFSTAISLFAVIYLENKQFIAIELNLHSFVKIFAYIHVVYIAKYLIIKLVSAIVKLEDMARILIVNTITVNNLTGIIIIPILLIYSYSKGMQIKDISLIAAGIIIISSVVFRLVKNFISAIGLQRYPIIYIIIYLCGLEIIPWFIIFKLLIKHLQA